MQCKGDCNRECEETKEMLPKHKDGKSDTE